MLLRPRTSGPSQGRLVGRDAELEALARGFDGGARVAFLLGPAGVGKSALAATFRAIHGAGIVELEQVERSADEVIASALDGDQPTLVVARAIHAWPAAPPGALFALELAPLAPDAAAELARALGASDPVRAAERAAGIPLLVERECDTTSSPAMLRRLRLPCARDVLAAAALVRTPTETLLGAMLEGDASAHFATLVDHVPLAKVGPRLTLPDTLREAALDELEARAPELRVVWSRRAQDALLASLDSAPQQARPRLVEELLHASSAEPYASVLWDMRDLRFVQGDTARARRAVKRFEGDASARWFDAWCAAPGVELVEALDGDVPRGFTLQATFHPDAPPVPDDPIVAALRAAVRAAEPPLAPHEGVRIARFWLDYVTHQEARPPIARWANLLEGEAVVSASVHHDVARWLDDPRRPFSLLCEAEIGDTRYGVFGFDRRREPASAPFARLIEASRFGRNRWQREVTERPKLSSLRGAALRRAVRDAFRSLHRAEDLDRSPLCELAHVQPAPGRRATSAELAHALTQLVDGLGTEGHDGTLASVLRKTYLEGPGKGLAVSAELGMGYSTYRRWLSRALERVARMLEARETAVQSSPSGEPERPFASGW
jgi:hypothetical protein